MPTHPERRNNEHPSTYFVYDRANQEEHVRLHIQEQMLTAGMGGVLAECAPDPANLHDVLDVGCGTGGWLIEVALLYPATSRLVGVDTSGTILEHARQYAEEQKVSDRVHFHIMDALRMLEFPRNSFDLVNERFGNSFIRKWDWEKILSELSRVTRPGGIIRVTEPDLPLSNSPALTRLYDLFLQAFYQAEHFFRPEIDGMSKELAPLFVRARIQDVQQHIYTPKYRAGTPEGQAFYENIRHFFRTILPFLRKWTKVPDDYETIYQQALHEMCQPDFVATWTFTTVWGTSP